MADDTIEFVFPFKGFDIGSSLSRQPPLTSRKLLNVWPFDFNARRCGAVRGGVSVYDTTDFGKGVWLLAEGMCGGTQKLVAVTRPDNSTSSLRIKVNGTWSTVTTPQMPSPYCSIAFDANNAFIADPASGLAQLRLYNPVTQPPVYEDGGVGPPISTSTAVGSYTLIRSVTTNAPTGCSLVAYWRARVVVSGQSDNPHLVWASAIGNPFDWDTSIVNDAGAAWVLNASQAGTMGGPVTALVPFTDDTLLIAKRNALYRLDGDVTAGGSLSMVTSAVGITYPRGWCLDGSGSCYFIHNNNFYVMRAGGQPQNVSGNRLGAFGFNVGQYPDFSMVFDRERNGVWIFGCQRAVTPVSQDIWLDTVNPILTYFYDIESDAFFPMNITFYGNCIWAEEGKMLIPNRFLNTISSLGCGTQDTYTPGTNTAISSFCGIGPVTPSGDLDRSKAIELDVVFASNVSATAWPYATASYSGSNQNLEDLGAIIQPDSKFSATLSLLGGPDPATVCLFAFTTDNQIIVGDRTVSTQTLAYSSWGWQQPQRYRISANSLGVAIYNFTIGKTWAIERITMRPTAAGRVR